MCGVQRYIHTIGRVSMILAGLFCANELSAQTYEKVDLYYDLAKKIKRETFIVKKMKNTAIRDSSYESYYQNGKLQSKGSFKNNKPSGKWVYYYEHGRLKAEGNLSSGVKVGEWIYFYENGNLNTVGVYDKGVKTGLWKFYYESSPDVLKTEGMYVVNKREGIWKFYDETGAFKAQADFKQDKGLYTEYYPNGTKKSEGMLVDGKSSGSWKYYHENGQLLGEGEEKEGLKEGDWVYYDKSGTLISKGKYENGKQSGAWEYFHPNGKLASTGQYADDMKEGDWTTFNTAGKKIGEGSFKSGKGIYREFYESGKLKIEGPMEGDKSEGLWNYYYETGEQEGKCFYTRGKGKYTGYYKDGTPKMEGLLEDGHKTGIWRLYKPNGELAGLYKTYYDKDAPVFEPVKEPMDTVVSKPDSLMPVEKPTMILRKKRSRYFTPRVNELRAYIVGANPLALLRSSFPVSVEMYYQERMGYELGFIYDSRPMFRSHANINVNQLYHVGYQIYLRQKFYQKDSDYGMFYFAHELRYTNITYSTSVIDTLMTPPQQVHLDLREKTFEYAVLVGNRLIRDSRKSGFTLDAFIGIGIGYRIQNKNWSDENRIYKNAFSIVNSSSIKVPFRLGITLGYVFPKAR